MLLSTEPARVPWTGQRKHYWWLPLPPFSDRAGLEAELDKANYAYRAGESQLRLVYLLSRAQRGLISYEKRTWLDLLSFCIQRGLELGSEAHQSRWKTKSVLEKADEEPVFSRLLELPAELRLRIFELHMASLPQAGATARPPPVTRVSRLLRHETLPLFYNIQSLDLPLCFRGQYVYRSLRNIKEFPGALTRGKISSTCRDIARGQSACRVFLNNAPINILEMVKHISPRIVLGLLEVAVLGLIHEVTIRWEGRINKRNDTFKMKRKRIHVRCLPTLGLNEDRQQALKETGEVVKKGLDRHFRNLVTISGGMKLRSFDFNIYKKDVELALE